MGDRTSNLTLSDLIAGRQAPANPYVGGARAALGLGLGMGWGDEAEAWLRSKIADSKGYDAELANINKEYAQYSKENPFVAPALEFTGGAAPMIASLIATPATGGMAAPAAAATTARTASALARLAANPYVRGAITGGATGAVSGAGSAQPGQRGTGAVTGGVVGTVLGGAAPAVIRGGGAGYRWLRDRIAPSEATVAEAALGKVARAVDESGMTPQQVEQKMAEDRARNIPSTLANADPALVDLAETVAQRSGPSGRIVEKKLGEQSTGARERAYAQTRKGLDPGNYYDDLAQLQADMKTKAAPFYEQAYAHGEVTDPDVLSFMTRPQFKQGMKKAEELLAAEGRKMPTVKITDPVTGKLTEKVAPTVEVLDQVKRGLDRLIESETDAVTGKTTSLGRAYTVSKNEFLDALDTAVPDYAAARAVYKGDADIANAMRDGMNKFKGLDHEQVIKLIAKMGDDEKAAYRTGVVRNIFSTVMDPTSGNINAAQRIIGSPEMQAKLQPLFDSPAKFELFKSALEREAQLFQQSNRVLGGAATGRRTQARQRFEEGSNVGGVVADAISGGWMSSLTGMVTNLARSATMTDEVAEKTAKLLMSSDPHEVAAAVKLLEQFNAKASAGAERLGKGETGAIMGTMAAFPPSPTDPNIKPENIENDLQQSQTSNIKGPDIEADLEAEKNANIPGVKMVTP